VGGGGGAATKGRKCEGGSPKPPLGQQAKKIDQREARSGGARVTRQRRGEAKQQETEHCGAL